MDVSNERNSSNLDFNRSLPQLCSFIPQAEMRDEIVPQRVDELRRVLGPVVFLPCNNGKGGKGPFLRGFQNLLPGDMTPEHIAQCERAEYRIGVLFGRNSGGLCGLDCDDDSFTEAILLLNPWLNRTLSTTCNRGRTFWLRLTNSYPKNASLKYSGFEVGEWRADGNQSVIAGQDTETGNWRRFVVKAPVLPTTWEMIEWPKGMEAGGGKSPRPWPHEPNTTAWTLPIPPAQQVRDVEREENVERRFRSASSSARSTSFQRDEPTDRQRIERRLYRELISHLKADAGERNNLLNRAVPFLICAIGAHLIMPFLLRHYDEVGKLGGWKATREEHEKSIRSLIKGCIDSYPTKLSPKEKQAYEALQEDDARTAFRIARDLSRIDDHERNCPPGLFLMPFGELAVRIGFSNTRAEAVLKKQFLGRIIAVEVPGVQRAKGERGKGTIWRWLL